MNIDILNKQKQFLADKLRNTSVMISGATGLIGSRIVMYLFTLNDEYDSNIKIIALYRNEEKKNIVFAGKTSRQDIEYKKYELADKLEINMDVDYIIHCAGISGGTKMHLKDPVYVFEAAYNGTKELLDFATENNVKGFLYVSSYEIYGNISSETAIKENEPCDLDTMILRNIYAEAKRFCESLCVAYSSKYGLKVYSGRLTSTFGNGVSYNDPRFFAEFARCIIEKKDIVLKSTGGTVRTYLDSDDAAAAFLYILANGEDKTVYNITNMSNKISIRDMAEKMIELNNSDVNLKFDIAEDITKLGFRKEGCTLINAQRLYDLGWEPTYSVSDTLIKLVKFMKMNRNL